MNDLAAQQARKIAEARKLLRSLEMDAERSNERSALVLLALTQLEPDSPWRSVRAPLLGVTPMMEWIGEHYGREYAPNTRETVRRQTLHQFVDAGLVAENPDQPDRPINSPKWCYQLTDEVLALAESLDDDGHEEAVAEYLETRPGLLAMYRAARELERIPVKLADGSEVSLSPGGQNVLLRAMVEEFCPRFTPGGEVFYIGDAARERDGMSQGVYHADELAKLGVVLPERGKMPDLIVYLRDRNWLVLMEAASTHGPVDVKRHRELKVLFERSAAGLVFVSCFPSRAKMRKYLSEIAWETEVWCADHPDHLIHFDGKRFLGPYQDEHRPMRR